VSVFTKGCLSSPVSVFTKGCLSCPPRRGGRRVFTKGCLSSPGSVFTKGCLSPMCRGLGKNIQKKQRVTKFVSLSLSFCFTEIQKQILSMILHRILSPHTTNDSLDPNHFASCHEHSKNAAPGFCICRSNPPQLVCY